MAARSYFLYATLFVYFIILLSLVSVRGFWLDEVLQLLGTRDASIWEMFAYLKSNPGSAPAGYLTQMASLRLFGFSELSARLPSLISSVAAAVFIALVACKMRSQLMLLTSVLFVVAPLQFRYALEGRPYLQALAFSIASTYVLLLMTERVSLVRQVSYTIAVLLGLYSQPFSVFVPLAHLLWICLFYRHGERSKLGRSVVGSIVLSALLFLPWYFFVSSPWVASIAPMVSSGQGFHLDLKTPLMIFREISGASYWGAAFILIGCLAGLGSRHLDRIQKLLLLATIIVPICGALVADYVFHYFVAIRQMIYAVPGLIILAASGFLSISEKRPLVGAFTLLSFLVTCGWFDLSRLYQKQEDWQAAASVLKKAQKNGCTIFVPADSLKLYRFFEPELNARLCPADLSRTSAIVLSRSPYSSEEDEHRAHSHLLAFDFRKATEVIVGEVKIRKYVRALPEAALHAGQSGQE